MARVKRGFKARRRRNKTLKSAKGFYGGRSRLIRVASWAVLRAQKAEFVGRKRRKRDFRRLWITRIGAAAKEHGISYSKLTGALKKAGILLNRKELADLAVQAPEAFREVVTRAKALA